MFKNYCNIYIYIYISWFKGMKKTSMHVNVREANNKILNIILYWDIIFLTLELQLC
jgi:hypothetical protein